MVAVPIQIPGVELLDELGHGTYSVVYRARKGDELYAVKVPLRNETGIKLRILGRRFRREAVVLARLRHPLLPRVLEVGVVDRAPYIIMELAVGETLAERIRRGPLTEEQVVDLARQLASVLGQVHESGLVHRDVKPRNIVFDARTSEVRLVDFGFAASIDAAFRILEPVGTLEYAAPEQVSDLRQRVDGRADLYALGCVMYECLTQSPPFPDLDPRRLLFQHGAHEIPDVRQVATDCSQAMASILKRLLARNPDDRYPSAGALLHDLQHIDDAGLVRASLAPYGKAKPATSPVPLIGRDKEMARLRREWAEVEAGRSKIVITRGPTGSGKTHLAQAIVHHVSSRGHRVLEARCHAWDPRPFSAIREIVEGNCLELAEEERSKVAQQVRQLAGDLAPLLGALSPTIATMLVDVARMPQSQDAQHIFVEGLAEFLSKLFRAMGPVIVVVDDLQWLDASSRRVLRRAIDRVGTSKILFLFSSRETPKEAADPDRFLDGLEFTEIQLAKLNDADVQDLVAAYLGASEVEESLVQCVRQLSDGTPLSAIEVLRMMLDEGHLLPSWGRWTFDEEAAMRMHVPQSTLGVLERRIEALDDMTKSTLRAAAILGMTFQDRLLPPICGLEEGHTTAALAEARRATLVAPARLGTHRFVHDSVREVLLRTISEDARSSSHQRAAEAMDETNGFDVRGMNSEASSAPTGELQSLAGIDGSRPSSVLVRGDPDADACYALASHYARGVPGRSTKRVYETNMAAGRLAFQSFDNQRALDFFTAAENAASLLSNRSDPALDLLVGEAKLRTGALEGSRQRFAAVLSTAVEPLLQAWALSRIAWIYQLQFDSSRAWGSLEQAFAKLEVPYPTDSPWAAVASWFGWRWATFVQPKQVVKDEERQRLEAICSLYYQAARLASLDEKPIRIVMAALSGAVPAERLGISTSLARIYVTLSFVFTAIGRRKTGSAYLRRAEDVARATADPVAIAHAMQIHIAVAAWQGNLTDAIDTGKRCLEEYGHWRELSEYCLIAYNQQILLEWCGRSLEAWHWMERMIDRVEHHEGDPFLLDVLELGARAALIAVGRESEAESKLRKLGSLTIRVPDNSGFHTWTYGPRLRIFTECGDFGPGFEALVAEFEAKKLNPRRVHLVVTLYYIHLAHARVHAILRAPEEQRAALMPKLASALHDLELAARIPINRAHALVVEAFLVMFQGAVEKASQLFAAAESLGQKENAPWILYSVHRGRAHLLRTQGRHEASRDQARIAEALASAHGMAYRRRWIQEEFGLREARQREHEPFRSQSIVEFPFDAPNGYLRTLLGLAEGSTEQSDTSGYADTILEELVQGLRAERGWLFFAKAKSLEGKAKTLELLAGPDPTNGAPSEADADEPQLFQEAFAEWVSTSGASASYLLTTTSSRAIVAAPLCVDDDVVGAVYADRGLNRGRFSESDGELLVALVRQVPLVLAVARALRSRQRIEEDLGRAENLESVARLAGRVAKDLDSILREAQAGVRALLLDGANGSHDKVRAIEAAVTRAEEVTRQLLSLASERAARVQRLAVNDCLRRMLPLLRELLGPNVMLTVRAAADLDAAEADPAQIDQLFVALVTRAHDSIRGSGTVLIETSNALVAEDDIRTHPTAKPGRYVRISVSDTGVALDPSERKRIFQPVTFHADEDHGLALGTLYRTVVENGGFIDVESVMGEGTTFRVYWPKAGNEGPGGLVTANRVPASGTETILLVEPPALESGALSGVLKGFGYRVLRAHDAVEALKLVSSRHFEIDMVISDLAPSGTNGLDLRRELTSLRKTLPFLYLSDSAAVATGTEFLQKPVAQEVLAKRVRELLDRREAS